MLNQTEIRTTIFQLLADIAPELESESELELDEDLREQVDLDSMDFLNLITSVSETYQIDIPQQDYGELVSFNDWVEYMSEKIENS